MNMSYLLSATYTWGQFVPVFCLVGLAVLLMLADAFLPRIPKQAFPLVGALGALLTACFMIKGEYANSFGLLACGATGICLLMLWDYRSVVYASVAGGESDEGSSELASLLLIACAGVCALTQARDLVLLFVSLEIVTLASYSMAGYFRRNQGSIEAGVKYLILGAVSTGALVMGIAWYFGTTGSFALHSAFVSRALCNPYLCTGFLVSLALLLAGAFFKVGAAPMHVWIPDVYQGAPTPVSAFLAVASKTAGFVVLMLLSVPLGSVAGDTPELVRPVVHGLAVVAGLTLIIGNLGAIGQQNVKRLLGYSSIGQAGFILIFFVALRPTLFSDVWFYLFVYGVATLAAFYAVAQVRMQRGSEELSAFRGMGRTNPRAAFLITVLFASLAGVPLTGGFLAKWSSFRALLHAGERWSGMTPWLLPIMIVCAAAGFYYYFKVLRAMYWEKQEEAEEPVRFSPLAVALLTVSALALLAVGTLPLLLTGASY